LNKNPKNIIQACLRQERVAQQKLFSMYNMNLYTSACTYLHNKELAKEVTHETWIDIFKGLDKYDETKSQLMTWMKTILIRKIWKLNSKKSSTVELNHAQFIESRTEMIIDKMSCDELLGEMEKIPNSSRMVFKMYVLEGYKHSEIAQFLDITESTSRVHLTKARKIMKERYASINQIIEQ